ncbi:MAG: NfeD family protein [Oscillospiraceae bacterium]|nr:NfeD family protein [Oscillospiraceae bacterium]
MVPMELIIWAVLFVIMVVAELATQQFVSAWFAVGAWAAFIAAFFLSFWWQFAIFAVVSTVLLAFTRPVFLKLRRPAVPTNAELDIGSDAIVIETVDPVRKTGRVRLNGVDWNAVAADSCVINDGETVKIKSISGTCLTVVKEEMKS